MVREVKFNYIYMLKQSEDIIQDIKRVKLTIVNVRQELKTLKRRVTGYRSWIKKHRKQQKKLHQELFSTIQERDNAIVELEGLLTQIEKYKKVCKDYSQIRYADKIALIKEAEELLFGETVLETVNQTINKKEQLQIFTDYASIK